ncbi:MAG: ATP-binding protein/SpoIIE family protein phosphatase [Methylobacter sp.]|nr:ATP-binding protein/SpoIIE family protein phosphatase [Methylobacter sp.]
MSKQVSLSINDSSQVAEARRRAALFSQDLGFDAVMDNKVNLIITEMASNIVKHASDGEIILSVIESPDNLGLDILAVDKGRGMTNIENCLRDGFSTAGSYGTGLGAIYRLSALFDIYSVINEGTAVFSRVWNKPPASAFSSTAPLGIGAVCLPMTGEDICGDAWAVQQLPERIIVMVADGLGHGPLAAEASKAAVEVFNNSVRRADAAGQLISDIHSALKHTRGAVVAVAEILLESRTVRYAGVGNISGTVINRDSAQRMVSLNGTAGIQVHKIREFTYSWPENSLLVMHSDGLNTRWRLDEVPILQRKQPGIIAGILYRDHCRARDDVAVVVIREAEAGL